MKILVVDDDEDLREALFYILSDAGHEVHQAESGNAAMRTLRSKLAPFDVVVCDYYMNDGSGLDLLDYIRSIDPQTPKFILITGQADRQISTVLDKGAQHILLKPFGGRQLLQLIQPADVK